MTTHPATPTPTDLPEALRLAERLLRNEATRLNRLYSRNQWYGFYDEKALHAENIAAADALAALSAAAPVAPATRWPPVSGVGRDAGHSRAVMLYLADVPTDDDLRALHDAVRGEAQQPTAPQEGAPAELCPSCRNGDLYACTCTSKAAQPQAGAESYPPKPEPVAFTLGLAKYAHSSNIFAAHEFIPDTEHADEWEPLVTLDQAVAFADATAALRARGTVPQAQQPGAAFAPVEMRDNYLDLLQDVLDAKEAMLAAGVKQNTFALMFAEFSAAHAAAPQAPAGEGGA